VVCSGRLNVILRFMIQSADFSLPYGEALDDDCESDRIGLESMAERLEAIRADVLEA